MKSVVVSGGFGKLGQAVVRALAPEYNIIVITRRGSILNDPKLREQVAHVIEADLVADNAHDTLAQALSQFPVASALVNAAADTNFHMFSHEIYGRQHLAASQLSTNVIGPAICAAALFETHWKDRPLSRNTAGVLNISSISGKVPFFGTRQCFYAASKSALNMLTLYMAKEYEPFNIRVNGLSFGSLSSPRAIERAGAAVRSVLMSDHAGKIFELSQDPTI